MSAHKDPIGYDWTGCSSCWTGCNKSLEIIRPINKERRKKELLESGKPLRSEGREVQERKKGIF
jgi:hypothetical protein